MESIDDKTLDELFEAVDQAELRSGSTLMFREAYYTLRLWPCGVMALGWESGPSQYKVVVDFELRELQQRALLVHEVAELYLQRNSGVEPMPAHEIAKRCEEAYARRKGIVPPSNLLPRFPLGVACRESWLAAARSAL